MYKSGLLTARKKEREKERRKQGKKEGRNKVMLKRFEAVPSVFGKA